MLARNALEQSYLKHILIAVECRDPSAPFRTFFDNWFAFKTGGPFLNASSRPHWFNNPCPERHGEALRRAHFVSQAAARTLSGIEQQQLVKDHAIPVAVLRDMLFEQRPSTIDDVGRFMCAHYRLGILTRDEDHALTSAGVRSSMPPNWTVGDNPFARYHMVGIVAQDITPLGYAVRALQPRSRSVGSTRGLATAWAPHAQKGGGRFD